MMKRMMIIMLLSCLSINMQAQTELNPSLEGYKYSVEVKDYRLVVELYDSVAYTYRNKLDNYFDSKSHVSFYKDEELIFKGYIYSINNRHGISIRPESSAEAMQEYGGGSRGELIIDEEKQDITIHLRHMSFLDYGSFASIKIGQKEGLVTYGDPEKGYVEIRL